MARNFESVAIFNRLTEKEIKEMKAKQDITEGGRELSFNEWLRRKDAERRMKKRLLDDAKNELRQELYELAQVEQTEQEQKLKIMDDWATHKKLNEAQNMAESRGVLSDREELER